MSTSAPIESLAATTKDLGGGFTVRRLLPALRRQAVGPFVFFDHFGPLVVQPADSHDVRPHPHIGLATLTYLFDGAMQHHDSTGAFQRIEPGAVNWMCAGRGVVHSERRPADLRQHAYALHGLQLWVAAPESHEDIEPSFQHVGVDRIPPASTPGGGARLRVLAGQAHGLRSPLVTMSPTLFVDYELAPGAGVELPGRDEAAERAVYPVQGRPQLHAADGEVIELPLHQLAVLPDDDALRLRAGTEPARVVLVGGTPLGRRHLWWNFVASRPERIERAAQAWQDDTLGQVPGETERIPLPAARFRAT
ncbi:MAG: pirin family protein [Rubrivivax sp.]